MLGEVVLFMGMPGGMELGVILLLVILLFGANKLPKLARASGQAMGEFRKGREEIEREIRDSARSVEEREDPAVAEVETEPVADRIPTEAELEAEFAANN